MKLLGGALLGAAAMYLLDPESGRRRRQTLAAGTGEALGRAGEYLGPAWERVSEGAASLGSAASDRAAEARDSASGWFSGWGDALGSFGRRFTRGARGYGEDAADAARDYRDSAFDYARRARGVLPWGHDERSHAGAYTAAGLSAAALGAAAIYFFDRTNGRSRRKVALDQVNRIVNDTGRCMRRGGQYVQDMMNRSRGLAHETRSRFTSDRGAVAPETLMQRIRSEMGHVVGNAAAISVTVDGACNVTLAGTVPAGELDALLTRVNRVPGVNEIINRLDVQESPEAVSGNAGTRAGQRL
jgi:hypothetical protein